MLAIVIPFFKLEFFESTLQSLADQTYQNFHVYIGNDASPEDPSSLIARFEKKINITYKEFKSNLGSQSLTKQWERCIGLIENERWIMILGDDDMLEKNVVESLYKNYCNFCDHTNLIRFASRIITPEETKNISIVYTHPTWETAPASYYRKIKRLTRSSLSEYVFLKEVYLKHRFHNYPTGWHSDDRAWFEFAEEKPIYTINEAIVLIRNSTLNISSRKDNIDLKNLASLEFYKFIIDKQMFRYQQEESLVFFRAYEDAILRVRKAKFSEWLRLYYLYLKNFHFYTFKKFNIRVLKNLLHK